MKSRLWIEFILFFVIAPIAIAVFMDPTDLFPMLFTIMGIGIVLLHFTPDFRWKYLFNGWSRLSLTAIVATIVVTGLTGAIVMLLSAPDQMFNVIKRSPMLMLMIACFYPLLSALPQEVVFRPLFFRRYKSILAPFGRKTTLVLNGAVFSLAHLMYWSPIVMIMTFFGGLIFAWAYVEKRSFPLAVILHSVAGIVLFALGMGVYFYSGNVVRPF